MLKTLLKPQYRLTLLSMMIGIFMLMIAMFAMQAQQDGRQFEQTDVLIGGPFELVTHEGETVTEAMLEGKFSLIFFGFTFCPDICPDTLSRVAEMYDSLNDNQQRALQVIFITADPARDTVESMDAYVTAFHKDFIGLTGTQEQVQGAIDAYKVYAVKEENEEFPEDYLINHSGWLYVMGPRGKYVAHMKHDLSVEDIRARLLEFL